MMMHNLTVALAGNPNSGKSALFNALTGSRQKVGNWPGVTVAKTSGFFNKHKTRVEVVDLPGTYSISVQGENGIDEKIACDFLASRQADLVVNVLDGSNLVRNLYLTLQLLEMNVPVILAVNMLDIVEQRGIIINLKQLEKLLGCKVLPLVASKKKGVSELKDAILQVATHPIASNFNSIDSPELNNCIDLLSQRILQKNKTEDVKYARWLALRLLEGDGYAKKLVEDDIKTETTLQIKSIEASLNDEPDILIADARYQHARMIADHVTVLTKAKRDLVTEGIDKIVLNRFLGIPIFLFIMYLMFVFAINVGGAFQDFFDISSSVIFVNGVTQGLQACHAPDWLIALAANGLGRGINTVVTFVPVIAAMFLFLAFLEDCGYMARAAFVMDRFMRALGLPGKSFVPMIVGFGCNVPAVMGARALSSVRDRILTIMMMPFMSCGARLAIFSVFASAFFPHNGALIIFSLYLIGILVAVLSGLLLRKTVLPGVPAPLVMELPSYHPPQLGALFRAAWQRLAGFLIRAGKYIIPICVIIGVLNSISITGKLVQTGDKQSILAEMGRMITPLFAPLGIAQHNWPATVGLATGVLAKEVVVGTLNSLYANEPEPATKDNPVFNFALGMKAAIRSIPNNLRGLSQALANPIAASEASHEMSKSANGTMYKSFNGKVGAFAYLLFVLLYFPCASTMAAMRRELNRKWAYFSVIWSTGLAYSLSVICYQLLTIHLHPVYSFAWIFAMCLGLTMALIILKKLSIDRNNSSTDGKRNLQIKELSHVIKG